MDSSRIIRILIVDDHEVVRSGLTTFLSAFRDFELVGEAANGREALALCHELKPDVVLMDVQMPDMDGPAAARAIRESHPEIQIVALSTFKDEDVVRQMLKAGAVGYLLKNTSIDELASAIRTALSGQFSLSPEAAKALLTPQQNTSGAYQLTERELEVLELMVKGRSNNEIADQLVLARSTVKFHVSSILSKLSVSSRTEAVSVALKSGLVKS